MKIGEQHHAPVSRMNLTFSPAPIYAFDIDGVLCDTRAVHRAALEEELGVKLEEGGHYNHFGFHHEDPEVLTKLSEIALNLWQRPTVFAEGEASGQDVVCTLAERGQLAGYVTRRHPKLYPKTGSWLFYHRFPLHPNEFTYFTVQSNVFMQEVEDENARRGLEFKTRIGRAHEDRAAYVEELRAAGRSTITLHHMVGDVESKAEVAHQMGATHLIEDSPHEAFQAALGGIDVVVLRRPYNAAFEQEMSEMVHDLPGRITFITSLSELL